VCELEQDSGPCEALFIRWWYDKGECKVNWILFQEITHILIFL